MYYEKKYVILFFISEIFNFLVFFIGNHYTQYIINEREYIFLEIWIFNYLNYWTISLRDVRFLS